MLRGRRLGVRNDHTNPLAAPTGALRASPTALVEEAPNGSGQVNKCRSGEQGLEKAVVGVRPSHSPK